MSPHSAEYLKNLDLIVSYMDLQQCHEAVNVVHSSTMMLKLLNSSILSAALIKNNRYVGQQQVVTDFSGLMDDFITIF